MAKLFLGTREITPAVPFVGNKRIITSSGVYSIPVSATMDIDFRLPDGVTQLGAYSLACAFRNGASIKSFDFSDITAAADGALYYAFYGCNRLTGTPDFSSLTTVTKNSLAYAFGNCTGLTGKADFSSLTSVGETSFQQTFYGCTGITSLDMSSLTTCSSPQAFHTMCRGCSNLESVDFSSLTQIGSNTSSARYGHFTNAFLGCNKLTTITFPELTAIYCTGGSTTSYGTFAGNAQITKLYFPKLTTITYGSGASSSNQNACLNVFYGCSALTELHFGSANQTAIQASPGYSTAWGRGASNVTISFDL